MQVLHVIPTLARGGAESQLTKLINGSAARIDHHVAVLYAPPVGADWHHPATESMHVLGLTRARHVLAASRRLRSLLHSLEPDVMHAWMYHANLLAFVANRPRRTRLVWSLRHSDFGRNDGLLTRTVCQLGALASWYGPDVVVCCGERVRRVHAEHGYARRRMVVIDNGFSVPRVLNDQPTARKRLGIPGSQAVIVALGRMHPQKDYETLLRAFARVRQLDDSCHLAIAGRGVKGAASLISLARELGVINAMTLLDESPDPELLYDAADVVCSSSSHGEGFSNVIAEAMARGKYVVATDSGDARRILGDAGVVVPVRDVGALGSALIEAAKLSTTRREDLGLRAVRRIEERFSTDRMIAHYSALYDELTGLDAQRVE